MVKLLFVIDIEGLKKTRNEIMDEEVIKHSGTTRQIVLDSFVNMIKQDLILLGVDEK